jgi:hypothetical protein
MAKYRSFRELGLEVKRQNPAYAKYSTEDAGRDVAAQLGIEVGDDRSFGERAWEDLGETFKEDLKGTIDAFSSPIETAKGIGMLAGGASDIWLGTDFVDEDVEEAARGAGRQYMEEIGDWENRPVRALSNIAIAGGPIGLAGKLGKASALGKIGRGVGRAVDLADPLTATGAAIGGVARGITKPIRTAASKGAQAITPEGDTASKQFFRSSAGLYSGQGEEAVRQVARRSRNKESRDVIEKQLLEGPDASLIAEDSFLRSYKKNLDLANEDYSAGVDQLKREGIWDKEYDIDIDFPDAITEGARAELAMASIFNKVFEEANIQIRMKEVRRKVDKDGPFTVVGFSPQAVGDKLAVSDKDLSLIRKVYEEKAGKVRRQGKVTFGNLDSFKKAMSNELRAIDPEGTTQIARKTYSGLTRETGNILRQNPRYAEIMRNYEDRANLIDKIDENFSIDPKAFELAYLQKRGERLTLPDLGERLKKSFDSNTGKAANKRELIENLEGATNNLDIGDQVLGARMQPLTANNLIGKAETSQAIRRIVGITGVLGGGVGAASGLGAVASIGVGVLSGAAAAIPAWILLSPRASTRVLSHLASKGLDIGDSPTGKKHREVASIIEVEGDKWRKATRSGGVSPDEIIDDLKNSGVSLGDLAKMVAGTTVSAAVSPTSRRAGAQTQRTAKEQERQGQQNIFRLLGSKR